MFLLTKKEGNMLNFQFLLFSLNLNFILRFMLILHFGLIMTSQELYTIIILLNCFEQYSISSNTVISDSFWKNIFVTLTSHFSKFSYMSLLLASYHDDINGVGAAKKIFYENELCIMQIKINQKSWFCIFKSSHSHSSYFVLNLH